MKGGVLISHEIDTSKSSLLNQPYHLDTILNWGKVSLLYCSKFLV